MASINPQDRYDTTLETKKLPNGRLVYKSARPKSIKPNTATDVLLVATDVARMDKISNDAYNTPMNWWKIASANGRVDGSLYFRQGTTIVVPA